MKGVLNLYKEAGQTSASAVAKARHILGTKQIGHMGTLDPQGTGVLLLGVGKATRLFDFYLGSDKEYIADFTFGYTTDTLDGDGTITATTTAIPDKQAVLKALNALTGTYGQMPPQYSAKSIGGIRAYDLARQGKVAELNPAQITVYKLELVEQVDDKSFKFFIHCSSGTYIRSICRDLAESLSSLACMTSIHRKRSGNFTCGTAVKLKDLERLGKSVIVPLEVALKDLERRDFDDSLYQKILDGIKIDTLPSDSPFTVYCKNQLFGIGKSVDGKLKIPTFLKD